MTRLLLPLIFAATVWYGSMTWYSLPGQTMRNGQPFDDDSLTCAVDDGPEWWDADADAPIHRNLCVCTEGICTNVAVTDTGHLAQAGVLVDCTKAVWRALGVPPAVGRAEVTVERLTYEP